MDDERNTIMIQKTVTIFGVFDVLHEGHLAFIKEARKMGDRLIAIVARDEVVLKLKNKFPKFDESLRVKDILLLKEVDEAYLGDEIEGSYETIKEINPNIIYLGYDQQALYDSLITAIRNGILSDKIEILFGKSHKGDTHHSSILNK
jgi:FAD synthetase